MPGRNVGEHLLRRQHPAIAGGGDARLDALDLPVDDGPWPQSPEPSPLSETEADAWKPDQRKRA
jgi:hypothetical protein